MAEITSNDKSFLIVAKELRQLENSIAFLAEIRTIANKFDSYTINRMTKLSFEEVYTPEVQKLIPFIALLCGNGNSIAEMSERLTARRTSLQGLADTYLTGGNLVAAKLQQD